MENARWEEGREDREREALNFHARLSKLFKEDRLAFERERKRLIDDVIGRARTEEERSSLRAMQQSIDRKMRNAGSEHNRLVLMQKLFWDQVETFRTELSRI